ncbi:hypothetical protein [Ammoniphilus sp. 3BR4]|uniref:hypothetical protein n=1 Tax=Ammoniphilus sp. 3BR4 TaxID=3158265 RepID=UPI003466F9E4
MLIIAGCSNTVPSNQERAKIENPTAEEILSTNRNADIFVVEGVVYSNADNVDWVKELDLNIGEEVIQITKQTNNGKEFENGTATKLPVGTKIYNSVEKHGPIYIAVVNGKEVRYLGLIEG